MSESSTKKLFLSAPVNQGSEEITVLTVRKPFAKDLRSLPLEPNMGDFLNVAARLCDQPPSVIDKLEVQDAMALVEVVSGFIPDGPATGETA